MRLANQRLLLELLYAQEGAPTRPQLSRASGLSQPTVAAALDGLQEAGLVRLSPSTNTVGRPATAFEIDPTAGVVLAVDVGRQWIRLQLSDLNGQALDRREARNTAADAGTLVDLIAQLRDEVCTTAGVAAEDITHTVVASPGVLDERHNRVKYAANLPGWHQPGLAQALQERLGGSMSIDNDANMAAIAELHFGAARDFQNFVYLHIGTGVGLGIIINGQLYRGASGAAGEIGYLPPAAAAPSPPDPLTTRGASEELLAADALVRYARLSGLDVSTAEEVLTGASDGDPQAVDATTRYVRHLVNLIAAIHIVLDPEAVVIGGGLGQNLQQVLPQIRSALTETSPMHPHLMISELPSHVILRGATTRGLIIARKRLFDSIADRA